MRWRVSIADWLRMVGPTGMLGMVLCCSHIGSDGTLVCHLCGCPEFELCVAAVLCAGREVLSDAELREMGKRFQEAKQHAPTR